MIVAAPILFPVRHYSPTAAHFVGELLRQQPFDAVLVEGPADFNPRMEELFFAHELPLALYTYVLFENGRRRGAFYPFCQFSPEWQALEVGRELGLPVRFIDLPWSVLATSSQREHRYSDDNFTINPYIDRLCNKLGVEDFDELWDVLFELPHIPSWESYLERARALCDSMRLAENRDGDEAPPSDAENARRERFMAANVRRAAEEFGPRLLVVTGGYHSSGLEALLRLPLESLLEEVPTAESPQDSAGDLKKIASQGIALTPFTYPRLDRLCGYAAGLRGPRLYERLWDCRRRGEPFDAGPLLAEIITELRRCEQTASTADLVAVDSTARTLARIRGRETVWRFDLLDALSCSLVKEAQDAEYLHPLLMTARQVMTGSRGGFIDPASGVPPLVQDVRQTLHELDLEPRDVPRTVELNLEVESERHTSRILHRCAFLGLAGIVQVSGADLSKAKRLTRIVEAWTIKWVPELDANLFECSAYGTTLAQAASSRALEWREQADPSAGIANAAGQVLLAVALMGLPELRSTFVEDLEDSISRDSLFSSVANCLRHLVFLHRFDDILETRATPDLERALEAALTSAFERGLWLYQRLGSGFGGGFEALDSIDILHQASLSTPREQRVELRQRLAVVSARVAADQQKPSLVRGAASGTCLRLGTLANRQLDGIWNTFYDPVDMGDFLTGLFRMAREAFLRDLPFLLAFDRIICDLNEEAFLEALPPLRMAFTFFTPREKLDICDLLFAKRRQLADHERHQEVLESQLIREQAAVFEARLLALACQYGLVFATDRDQEELTTTPQTTRPETRLTAETPLKLTALRKTRWRLVLGHDSRDSLGDLSGLLAQQDELLAFLYDREVRDNQNIRRGAERHGGLGDSSLSVPQWINGIHELFPKRTIERLEKDAVERYDLEEMVTRPEVLERLEPNLTLLKAVLRCRPLMNQKVLSMARNLVRKVIEALMEKWSREVESPFLGVPDPRRRSNRKIAKNFAATETIRLNLRHFDTERGQLVVRKPIFFSRKRRHVDRWQVIILVDQSGSMLDSVIHAAITASIFAGVPSIRNHLVVFDTSIVDLTDICRDPVETLMSLQLGGGTDINNALCYAERLVENPRRTIIVLISDFYEGGNPAHLLATTKSIVESGIQLLGLAALDAEANPNYDRVMARAMVELGAHVGAMTPGELAAWVAEKVG